MDEEIKNELEKLSKDPSSGFKVLKTNIHIALGPSALGGGQENKIIEELDERLNEYHRDFDGMLLHYEDVKVTNTNIRLDYKGFPHLDVKLKAYVFQPRCGVKVNCSVFLPQNKILDCRIFNKMPIRVNLYKDHDTYNAGDKLLVELTEVVHNPWKTKLTAKIVSVVCRNSSSATDLNKKITFDDSDAEENIDAEEDDNSKSRKRKSEDLDESTSTAQDDLTQEQQDIPKKSKKKKSKKEKDIKSEEDIKQEPPEVQEEYEEIVRDKSKKKKSKKEKEIITEENIKQETPEVKEEYDEIVNNKSKKKKSKKEKEMSIKNELLPVG